MALNNYVQHAEHTPPAGTYVGPDIAARVEQLVADAAEVTFTVMEVGTEHGPRWRVVSDARVCRPWPQTYLGPEEAERAIPAARAAYARQLAADTVASAAHGAGWHGTVVDAAELRRAYAAWTELETRRTF